MFYILSTLIGILIAFMVTINGQLTTYYDVYSSTLIINIVALFSLLTMAFLHRQAIKIRFNLPFLFYTGGILGVLTTLFNNIAFGKISITAILALTLLGQSIFSLLIDHYGLFRANKDPIHPLKLIGIAVITTGIVFMLLPLSNNTWIPIIVSLLAGFTIVISRTTNAVLADQNGLLVSTILNYTLSFIAALIIFVIAAQPISINTFTPAPSPIIYLGGALGALIVYLSNATATKISSFYMTLFLFIGQTATGIFIDYLLLGTIKYKILIGALVVTAGLVFNLSVDQLYTKPLSMTKSKNDLPKKDLENC